MHASGLWIGVYRPILRNVVPYDEDGRLVSSILHNVFLLGNLDKEAGALAFRDSIFHMVGRQHALKATNGVSRENPVGKFYPRQSDIHRSFYLHR